MNEVNNTMVSNTMNEVSNTMNEVSNTMNEVSNTMVKKKVIILNGAPKSGKDFIGNMVADYIGAKTYKFATNVDVELCERVGMSASELVELSTRWNKDTVRPECLNGMTLREARIHQAEVITKPVRGKDYYGKLLADEINRSTDEFIVITDGGFYDEVKAFIDTLYCGEVIVITLDRDDATWDGDSREPLSHRFANGVLLENNGCHKKTMRHIINELSLLHY